MDKEDRNTVKWFHSPNRPNPLIGPGRYNSTKSPSKESFNYGKVPFGSSINRFKGGILDVTLPSGPDFGTYFDL